MAARRTEQVRRAEAPRAGYPRLAAAWRLLAAAPLFASLSLAHADATVPSGKQGPPGRKPGEGARPAPPPPRRTRPHLGGDYAPVQPVDPAAAEHTPHALLLHPHAPGEPCFPIDCSDEEATS
jgi:hypothetical protein